MGMFLLFSLAFVLFSLGLWQRMEGPGRDNLPFLLIFAGALILAVILGGLYWSSVANPDASLLEPILAATLASGTALSGLFYLVLPRGGLGAASGGAGLYLLPLLFFPGFFLLAAAPPFLWALAFPEEKGTGRGLFTLASVSFLSLALALAGSSLWEKVYPPARFFLADLGFLLLLSLALWLWCTKAPRDAEEIPLRFFPVKSLGSWTGDKIYGQEVLVSPRAKKTLHLAAFLGAAAAGGLLLSRASLKVPWEETRLFETGILAAVSLGLGSLLLGPLLARLTLPMLSVALNQLIMSVLLLSPSPTGSEGTAGLIFSLAPLVCCGALPPLALRVGVSRHDFLAYSIGKMNARLAAGFFLGLCLGALFLLKGPPGRLDAASGLLSLFSAFMAAGPTLSWPLTVILTAVAGLLLYIL
jgi:hypothetical protein